MMQKKYRRKWQKCLTLLLAAGLLSGCAGAEKGADIATQTPIPTQVLEPTSTPAPTQTPAPTEEPTEEPTPTRAPTSTPTPTPIIAVPELATYMGSTDPADQIQLLAGYLAENINHWDSWFHSACYYTVTDLDQNGRLELIVSMCGGSGYYSDNRYYEVNEDFSGCVECDVENEVNPESAADIVHDEEMTVYYDVTENEYYYITSDYLRGGGSEYYVESRWILKSGEVIYEDYLAEKAALRYGMEEEFTYTYYDHERNEITESEYEEMEETVFVEQRGYQPMQATLVWDWYMNEDGELAMEWDELVERMWISYEGFSVGVATS